MSGADHLLDEWRQRHPVLRLAEVFLEAEKRTLVLAWWILLDEMQQAAFELNDDGVAQTKLSWWSEELQRGVRGEARHPLAQLLFGQPDAQHVAPVAWARLATSALRVRMEARSAANVAAALEMLRPLSEAVAAIEAQLLGNRSHPPAIAAELLLERLLRAPLAPPEQARLPLNLLARHGLTVAQALDAASAAGAPAVAFRRDYASGLLERLPEPRQLNRARQIRAALTRRQLHRMVVGHAPEPGTGPLLAFATWRAARRAAD